MRCTRRGPARSTRIGSPSSVPPELNLTVDEPRLSRARDRGAFDRDAVLGLERDEPRQHRVERRILQRDRDAVAALEARSRYLASEAVTLDHLIDEPEQGLRRSLASRLFARVHCRGTP